MLMMPVRPECDVRHELRQRVTVYAGTEVLQRRVYRLTQAESAVQAITVAFPNWAAVGLPLLGSVLGPSAVLSSEFPVSLRCVGP
jgi:hypothetical protein